MSKPLISQVWIFRNSGIPIVGRAYGPKLDIDETLFTGMLSAFIMFAEELKQGTFEGLQMTNLTLFTAQENKLLFVIGLQSQIVDNTLIAPIMDQIKQTFFHIFPDDIINTIQRPHNLPKEMLDEFQAKLDQIINQKARKLSYSEGYNPEKVNQTLRAVAKKDLSPTSGADVLLDEFDNFELKTTMKQVVSTIDGMISLSDQLQEESPLQNLLHELNRFVGLWGKTVKIAILGLDQAGKTAIIHKIQGLDYQTTPTTTLSVERINFRNSTFACWDMPGQKIYRKQMIPNSLDSNILVFVIDGTNSKRWKEAKKSLNKILKEYPTIPLALLLNKSDHPEYTEKNFSKVFYSILKDSKRHVVLFKTSAVTGQGLEEMFQWIFDRLITILSH